MYVYTTMTIYNTTINEQHDSAIYTKRSAAAICQMADVQQRPKNEPMQSISNNDYRIHQPSGQTACGIPDGNSLHCHN